jgi:hypothetical protein
MKQDIRPWTPSSLVLAAAGLAVIGVGLYFMFLRPPLLPEDLRYLALPAAQLDIVKPRLSAWLAQVFTVLGGYAVATGVLAVSLAATSFRARSRAAAIGAAVGGAASIGLMAAVNFSIASDFKWVLLGMAILWGAASGCSGGKQKASGRPERISHAAAVGAVVSECCGQLRLRVMRL